MHYDYGYSEENQLGKPYDMKLIRRLIPYAVPYRYLFLFSIILVIGITLVDLSIPYITKIAIDSYIVPQENNKTGSKAPKKYFTVNLEDPAVREIVNQYSQYFTLNEKTALITYEKLKHLKANDLKILRKDDLKGVMIIAFFLLGLVIIHYLLNFFHGIILEKNSQMIMHDIRIQVFSHIQELNLEFYTKNPVGRLVTRVTNDVQNMHEVFNSVVAFLFKDSVLLVGITLVLLSIHLKLALLTFTVIPVVLAASVIFSSKSRSAFRIMRIKIAEINTRFAETINGMQVLQMFRMENDNEKMFQKLNHENYLADLRQIKVFALFMPLVESLGIIAIAIVIYYGGNSLLENTISLGALVAYISYMKMFFKPIRDMAEKYNILQNAMASAERIFSILDNTSDMKEQQVCSNMADPIPNIKDIVFDRVSLAYIPGEPVLKEISLTIKAGETIALVGSTGAGKTSLMNLMIRFYDPTSGKILINQLDLGTIAPAWIRSKTALVTQDPFLFSGTIRDNIAVGNIHITDSQLKKVIELARCQSLISQMPDGINTVIAEGGKSISSGQRQLISIARAFANNPDIIILDEATSYIDSETEQKIQSALTNLMQGRTAVIIAHRLSTARMADHIYVMNRGRIIENGNHKELMNQKGFYYNLSVTKID
ncbi:xenobiotic ABC transporter ATP-binding protein [Candidatus Magnetomorum sp. HK-1]|nr:xenobiotic ABC transporter ATP-binding protein [Candidatus Magnetomorum sp. HK-1]